MWRCVIYICKLYTIMGDTEDSSSDEEVGVQEHLLDKKIEKEIEKLQYYLEEADELIKSEDYNEIEITCKRTGEVSSLQELKLEHGSLTQKEIRLWKKELKVKYSPLLDEREKLCKAMQETNKY